MKEATKLWIGAALLAAYTIGWICGESKADSSIHDWLSQWQTLIAGLAALAGAGVGAAFLHRQTRQDRGLENERRQQRLLATRAILPLALSSLIEWIRSHGELLQDLMERCQGNALLADAAGATLPLPALPEESFTVLQNLIEYLPVSESPTVLRLLSDIQVHTARMRTLRNQIEHPTHAAVAFLRDLQIYTVDAAEICAVIGALFNYARFQSESVPLRLLRADVREGLHNIGLIPAAFPEISAMIERRYPD